MDELMLDIIEDIKNLPIEKVIRKWSGVSFQIPTFRGEIRKKAILEAYKKLENSHSQKNRYIILSMEFNVSPKFVRKVVLDHRRKADHNDHSDHNPQ